MKRYITAFITLTVLLSAIAAHAQQIETKRGRYYVEGEKMNTSEIISLMESNPEAQRMMKYGTATAFLSLPIVIGGGSLVMSGWMEGLDLFGVESEVNYTKIGLGSALTIVGLVMAAAARSQRSEAVYLFNSAKNKESLPSSGPSWQLEATGPGLKLSVIF